MSMCQPNEDTPLKDVYIDVGGTLVYYNLININPGMFQRKTPSLGS